jgi:SpoIID/LytB domain protein
VAASRRSLPADAAAAGTRSLRHTGTALVRSPIPRSLVALAALLAAVTLTPAPNAAGSPGPAYVAPAGSGALFLLSGHGSGHGVGMGQWGAEGYALQGYTYDQILDAYYPGTILGQTEVTSIRVLLANGKKTLAISSGRPVTVEDGNGVDHTLPAGKTTFTPSLALAVDGGPKQALPPPLTFAPADGSNLTLGRAYRGQIVVDVVSGKLRAINVLPLDQYLYGVVPAEEPSHWLPAALEAQAVASRSYALASRRAGAPFDVYADTRSQVYLGVKAETPAALQAVDETAGEVLLYNGHIATTFFSSSSGGRTQSAADAWGGAGQPYLVSMRDPYDGISPYHNWGPVAVTGKALGNAVEVAGRVLDATVERNSSRRVSTVTITSLSHGAQGTTAVTGATTASALGLHSTWFSVAVLSLLAPSPNPPVTAGTRVRLSGIVRGVRGVVVQARSPGTPWRQLRTIAPAVQTGAFHLTVRPKVTTEYRLATAQDAAAFVRIRVALP